MGFGSFLGGLGGVLGAVAGPVLGGQDLTASQQSTSTTTHQAPEAAIPEQMELLRQLIGRQQAGSGEFGFGGAAKQGQSTLLQALGSRGISPQSPAAQGALAQLLAQSAAADSGQRRQMGLSLLNAAPRMFSRGSTTESSGSSVQSNPDGGLLGSAGELGLGKLFNLF